LNCASSLSDKRFSDSQPAKNQKNQQERTFKKRIFGKAENAVYLGNLLKKQQEVPIYQGFSC